MPKHEGQREQDVSVEMRSSFQLYVGWSWEGGAKGTLCGWALGLGQAGTRGGEGQGLSCGPPPGECRLLKGSRGGGSGSGGFGQHLYSKLWGSVGLLECGSAFGLEPHTRVTFIRTGKRNSLPWMIYGRACILGMWYCNLCYRIRTSVSREVCTLTMSISHQGSLPLRIVTRFIFVAC